MKSVVAFSDLHYNEVPEQLKEACEHADYVFFLGDGLRNLKEISYADNFHGVCGNCDYTDFFELEEIDGEKYLNTYDNDKINKYYVVGGFKRNLYGEDNDKLNG